jgi:hypothetical protein
METNPNLKICQSCAMAMESAEDFGTNHDGGRSADYCCYCYESGRFQEPDVSMDMMLEKVAGFLVAEMSFSEADARAKMNAILPKLKRWQLR